MKMQSGEISIHTGILHVSVGWAFLQRVIWTTCGTNTVIKRLAIIRLGATYNEGD